MIQLVDRCTIPAPPERIWHWFENLEENYLRWHPAHLDFKAIRGSPIKEGSICFFDTHIDGFRLRMRTRVVKAVPMSYLRHVGLFPTSLTNTGGSFEIEPAEDGSVLIAKSWIGYEWSLAGTALDRLIEWAIPVDALRRHMAEEGQFLSRILSEPP